MSTTLLLDRVIEQATILPQDEQLKLIEHLIHNMQQSASRPASHKKWRDIRGMAKYPTMGMDAQEWVAQNRRDAQDPLANRGKKLPKGEVLFDCF